MITSYPNLRWTSITISFISSNPRHKVFNTMTCCYKTSSLQAFIPIPELCGNVAKVRNAISSIYFTYSFSALRCWCSCEHRAAPHLCPFWGSPSRKVSMIWHQICISFTLYKFKNYVLYLYMLDTNYLHKCYPGPTMLFLTGKKCARCTSIWR